MIRMQPEQLYGIGGTGYDNLITCFQGSSVHAVNLEFCGLVSLFLETESDL